MSLLLDSLRQLIQRQITERGIVVWYDPEHAYSHAVDRLDLDDGITLLKYEDGYFRLREQMESHLEWIDESGRPIADREVPPKLLAYVPLARADSQFALVEVETAGTVIEPGAAVVERNTRLAALTERVFTKISPEKAGHFARQVEDGLLTFEDLEQMAEEAGSTGALKLIFGQASPMEVLLRFASGDEYDAKIIEKNALQEIAELAANETGLKKLESNPAALRKALSNHLLLGEMALFLPEGTLVKLPDKAVQRDTIRHLCETWRNRLDLQDAYAAAEEAMESTSGIEAAAFLPDALEDAETFAAIDKMLLVRSVGLLMEGRRNVVVGWAAKRKGGFWSRRNPELLLQWSLVETASDLLERAETIAAAVRKRKWSLDEMVSAYVHHAEPWMKLDTCARHLESRYARFYFEQSSPAWEKLMAKCRTAYLGALDAMAEAYSQALEHAGFSFAGAGPQSGIFKSNVAPLLTGSRKTAYFLVDALRYEMAVELIEGLASDFTVKIQPALGQLPGITPVGMGALMPGAEDGLSLDKQGGKLQVLLGDKKITDRAARMDWLRERTGDGTLVVKLGEVLRITPKKKKDLAAAKLLVVTSQEIDRIGEEGSEDDEARVYMDDVLEKLRRAIRNLASVGITDFVIAADHGYIFAEGFEAGLKMNPPGGETVEMHPRCWIGQGGTSADGFFRVSASTLELGGPLECAFPRSLGTFKVKGGSGAYFHGGPTLQEQIIPVVHLQTKAPARGKAASAKITVAFSKGSITNRFFSVTATLESDEMFTPEARSVRVEVLSGKDVAGHAAMAAYGFEEGSREITIEPGRPNSITIMLTASPARISLRLLNSKDDAPLATMNDIPVNLSL